MTLVEEMGEFVARASWEDVSEPARELLKIRVLDSIGCALGALGSETTKWHEARLMMTLGADGCARSSAGAGPRTLRIPDDGATYPLPPGLGQFPIRHVDDCTDRVPDRWREHGGVFIPMFQREALWLSFHSNRPVALKVGIGKVDALTGKRWSERLTKRPQNYLVCPDPQLTP